MHVLCWRWNAVSLDPSCIVAPYSFVEQTAERRPMWRISRGWLLDITRLFFEARHYRVQFPREGITTISDTRAVDIQGIMTVTKKMPTCVY